MRAIVTAVVAAIEGGVAAIATLVVIAIPAVVLWVVTFGIAAEQETVAAAIAGVWLLAHFVPMQFALSQETMLTLGVGSEPLTFALSLAPLSITLVSALFAVRAGGKLQRSGGRGALGLVGGAAGFALGGYALVYVAGSYNPWPVPVAVLVPTLVYAVPMTLTFIIAAAGSGAPWWQHCVRATQRAIQYLGLPGVAAFPARAATVFKLAAASLALLMGISAGALALTLATNFADVIAIAQGLQLDIVGSILIFLVQLFVLPIGVIWALAWLSGAGFSAGGVFSAFTESVATLPSLPILGALPGGSSSWGAVAPMIVVLAHLLLGILFGRRAELRRISWPGALTLPVVAALVSGVLVAGLCVLASGSLGPGLLADLGPAVWLTAGLTAAEAAVGLLAGVSLARWDTARFPQLAVVSDSLARWTSAREAVRSSGDTVHAIGEPGDEETLDLSQVREDAETMDTADAEVGSAPVIDLFAEVLHERTDHAHEDADAKESDDAELAGVTDDPSHDESEPIEVSEVFDIESVATGDLTDTLAQAQTDAEAEALLRAFAWDAADSSSGPGQQNDNPKAPLKFGRPNWRGHKK